jgi:hypothetical protein
MGTVDYVAPEQIRGDRVDARTDVYALGCVAYECLAGRVPFDRSTAAAKLVAHVSDPPPRLEGVPRELADAVVRAMAKEPAERYLSAGDFAQALAAGVQGRREGGSGRAVARGDAAIRDAATVLETAEAPELGETVAAPRGAARGRVRGRWIGLAGVALAAAIVVAVVLAINSGGTRRVTTTVPPKTTPTTTTTTSTSTTPNPLRAVLPPAKVPPAIDECNQKLFFGADGTAGPLTCSNGNLNAIAWKYYATAAHQKIMSLGPYATPQQAFHAMCTDKFDTLPLERDAYTLAMTYYGWKFGVDPSEGFPDGC